MYHSHVSPLEMAVVRVQDAVQRQQQQEQQEAQELGESAGAESQEEGIRGVYLPFPNTAARHRSVAKHVH